MDPLSIIVSVGALSKATCSISKFLIQFIRRSSSVTQPCKDLADQIEIMTGSLDNLRDVLEDPNIIDAETVAAERSDNEWETSKLWSSVQRSVLACREVLSKLQKSITGFRSDPSSIPQKMWLQIRLNMKEPDMRETKDQLTFHLKILQSTVQTLSLRAIYLIPGRVNADILPRIAGVEDMIRELRSLLDKDIRVRNGDNHNNYQFAQFGMDVAKDTIESALEVMSSAKTAYSQSEAGGSVMGDPLDATKAASISLWVPEPIPEHPLPRAYRSPSYNSVASGGAGHQSASNAAASGRTPPMHSPESSSGGNHRLGDFRRIETFTSNGETIANSRIDDLESSNDAHSEVLSAGSFGTGQWPQNPTAFLAPPSNTGGGSNQDPYGSEEEDSGNDSDMDIERMEAEFFFSKGSGYLELGQYQKAMECLKAGMDPASKLGFKLKKKIRFNEHKLLLSTCQYQLGDLQSAEQILTQLCHATVSKQAKSSDDDGLQLCQASFLLALIHLRRAEENAGQPEPREGQSPTTMTTSESLSAANSYCRKAMKGRWRIEGPDSLSYFESVYLLSLIQRASGNMTRADGHLEMIPADKRPHVVRSLARLLGSSTRLSSLVNHIPSSKEQQVGSKSPDVDLPARPATSGNKPLPKPIAANFIKSAAPALAAPQLPTTASPYTEFEFSTPIFSASREKPSSLKAVARPPDRPATAITETYVRPQSHKGSTTTTTTSMFDLSNFDLSVLRQYMDHLPQNPGQAASPINQNTLPPPELLVSWLHRFDVSHKPFAAPIHIAAAIGHLEAVNLFLQDGVDASTATGNDHASTYPKVVHCRGATPLHFAATYDQAEVARVLLRGNTIRILEMADKERRTALHYAARAGAYSVLVLLLDRKANVSAKDVSGNTPAILAAMYGHLDCLQLLSEHGASVHAITNEKCTALHFAAASGHFEVVEFLLSKRVDVDAKSGYGQTPLIRAAETGTIEIVRLLIAQGVDVNVQDHRARTPLHAAATWGRTEIVRLLIESGTKTSYCDLHGKNALDLAKFNKHEETVLLLKNPPKLTKEEKERLKRERKDLERQRKSDKELTNDSVALSKETKHSKEAKDVIDIKGEKDIKDPVKSPVASKGGIFSFRKKSKADPSNKGGIVVTAAEAIATSP